MQCAVKIGSVLVKRWDRKAEHSSAHGGCYTVFLRSDTAAIFFSAASFGAVIIREWRLFLWQARRLQRRLDKVHMSDTVTTVRRCQSCQPWKRVVQHELNSPIAAR